MATPVRRIHPDRAAPSPAIARHAQGRGVRTIEVRLLPSDYGKLEDLAHAEACTIEDVVARLIRGGLERPRRRGGRS